VKDNHLLKAALAFLLVPIAAAWTAYVMVILWAWFVAPLGMHAIGKAHAYGLIVLIGLIRARMRKADDTPMSEAIMFATLAPAFALLTGWIAHSLMGGA
jgi:hypothetical protein